MSAALKKHLHEYLRIREKNKLLRKLTPSFINNNPKDLYLNLNDYLQLSKHPRIIQAAQQALAIWGDCWRIARSR